MASLYNTKISATYPSLIKTLDTTAVTTATLKLLSDGNGTSLGLSVNNQGDFKVNAILEWGSLKDTGTGITITNFVNEADGIANNDNDTSIPTSASVVDYVSSQIGGQDLDFSGDSGTGAVILSSETFAITGTTNQIETTASGTGLALSLPSTVHRDLQGNVTGDLTGNVTATSILADGVIGTTQALADDSTKVATTAFVQDVVGTIPAGLVFQGTWNADTNTPTLASGTGTTGHFYIVSVAGSTDLDGITDWAVGDWAVFVEQGATDQWEKVDNSSVLDGNGTGGKISKWAGSGNSVTLTDSVITESGSNIGIGVSNPTEKFEVDGAILWSGALGASQTSAGVLDRSGDNLRIRAYGATAGSGALQFRTGGGADAGDSLAVTIDSSQAIQFNSYGAGTLVADASGNITSISGGGEGGPYLPLAGGALTGNVTSTGNITVVKATFESNNNQISIIDSDDSQDFRIQVNTGVFSIRDHTNSQTIFKIDANAGSEALYLQSSGATFAGDITTNGDIIIDNSSGDPFLKLKTTAQEYVIRIDQSDSEKFQIRNVTSGVNSLIIDTSSNATFAGNVGLGGTGLYTASHSLNIDGTGLAIKNDTNGSSNNWSSIKNTDSGGNSNLLLVTGQGTALTLNHDKSATFAGNVGIGVTPTEKLDVYGNIKLGTTANSNILNRSDSHWIQYNGGATTNNTYIRVASINAASIEKTISFHTNASQRMTIDSAGQVGIGTASPDRILHIESDTTAAIQLENTSEADSFIDFKNPSRTFRVGYDDSTDLFKIAVTNFNDNSLVVDSAGNVGIGEDTPSAKLHIKSPANARAIKLQNLQNNSASYILWLDELGAEKSFIGNGTSAGGDADELVFGINAVERMRIDSAGDVGIGVATPNAPLHIQKDSNASDVMVNLKNLKYGSTNTSGETKILFGWLNHEAANIAAYKDGTVNRTGFKFVGEVGYNTPVELMRITSAGNVGIGVDAPTTKLDVNGGLNISNANWFTFGGANTLFSSVAVGGLLIQTPAGASNTIFRNSAGTESMRIDGDANVGIGTSSPDAKLEISETTTGIGAIIGNTTHNSQLQIYTEAAGKNSEIWFGNSADDNVGKIDYDHNINSMLFTTNATEKMRITSAGDVLFGTTVTAGVGGMTLIPNASNGALGMYFNRNATTATSYIQDFRNGGSTVGFIAYNSTSVNFATSSDYRLKENVVGMTGALDRVAQLKPSRFNFIADSDTTIDGFLAHEVQSIVPEAVTGTKDAMKDEEYEVTPAVYEDKVHPAIEEVTDEEGNVITEAKESWTENVLVTEAVMGTRSVEDYQGIDQSKLVPLLVGAIQELRAEIELLKSK